MSWIKVANDAKRDFSCVMVVAPKDIADQVRALSALIPDEDIFPGEKYGREEKVHATALYGLHTQNPEDVRKILEDFGPIMATIGPLSLFSKADKDYDVLKFDIESSQLNALHEKLKAQLENTESFPDFHPHLTVTYLKKGCGKKYADGSEWAKKHNKLSEKRIQFSDSSFSDADSHKVDFPLKKKVGWLREAMQLAMYQPPLPSNNRRDMDEYVYAQQYLHSKNVDAVIFHATTHEKEELHGAGDTLFKSLKEKGFTYWKPSMYTFYFYKKDLVIEEMSSTLDWEEDWAELYLLEDCYNAAFDMLYGDEDFTRCMHREGAVKIAEPVLVQEDFPFMADLMWQNREVLLSFTTDDGHERRGCSAAEAVEFLKEQGLYCRQRAVSSWLFFYPEDTRSGSRVDLCLFPGPMSFDYGEYQLFIEYLKSSGIPFGAKNITGWLKQAEIVEVVVNQPSESITGTCAFCATMDGKPVSEVGMPIFHPRCKCRTEFRQMETSPENILEEEFQEVEPIEDVDDLHPRPEGGVEEL